jgi:alkylation response protein AidB-like acyl-CoA dehydrogenase
VNLATDHAEAWAAFVAGGWTTIDGPVEYGGAGLPMLLHSACEEMFNRAGIAFGMLSTPICCAARVMRQIRKRADQA